VKSEEKEIMEIVESVLKEDLFIVDVIIKGNTGNQKVIVLIDGDNGVSIDQCSEVSRKLGNEIEERGIIPGKYILEVSSPGLDFPLSKKRQYNKNIGRTLTVELNDGTKIEGKLNRVEESSIEVNDQSISFEEIKQSKVKISFK